MNGADLPIRRTILLSATSLLLLHTFVTKHSFNLMTQKLKYNFRMLLKAKQNLIFKSRFLSQCPQKHSTFFIFESINKYPLFCVFFCFFLLCWKESSSTTLQTLLSLYWHQKINRKKNKLTITVYNHLTLLQFQVKSFIPTQLLQVVTYNVLYVRFRIS